MELKCAGIIENELCRNPAEYLFGGNSYCEECAYKSIKAAKAASKARTKK